MKYILLIILSLYGLCELKAQKANYALAEKFRAVSSEMDKYSTAVHPNYIAGTDLFWYEFRTREGSEYYLVDPRKRTKRLLFDNAELLSKISEITRKPYHPRKPGFQLEFEKDAKTLVFETDGKKFAYNVYSGELSEREKTPAGEINPYWKYYSDDSLYMLFARNHNLCVVGNGDKGRDTAEVALTVDGEENYSFMQKEYGTEGRIGTIARWIPNTHKFYAVREDERKVKDLWLIDALASPRPELKTYKAELAGDEYVTQYELVIGDVDTRKVTKINADKWKDQYIAVVYASKDGKRIYFQRYKRTWDEMEVCVADTETGEVKVLIHETDKPYLDHHMRSISFLNDGEEILLRSERTGWGHYYLYDKEGKLKHTLTSGAWVAGPVQRIDTANRMLYFIGLGREKGIDPYYYILYKVGFDGKGLECLTPEDAGHEVHISPSCNYFVDNYSRVDLEPRMVLRNAKGKILMDLAQADLSRLHEIGWKMPERFKVKAADGVTDLYGVMWKPLDFDSTKSYPIISGVYPGPHFEYVATRFTLDDDLNTRLAQLGFIVINVGHRGGTPMRGKYYHTYGYGNQRDYPLADDKYAIEQLADRYPFINAKKVGIFGHSGGGFMSAAALLAYPDFYSAAVASAGNHDNNIYNKGWVEIHFGVKENKKVIKDSVKGDREEITFSTKSRTAMELAKNYKGGLLLCTGDMDKTVNPSHTLRLADALIRAGKNFDMIVLPGSTHGFFGENGDFFERKMWFHFARHLLGDNSADFQYDMDYFIKR